jgi:hypothetical protein
LNSVNLNQLISVIRKWGLLQGLRMQLSGKEAEAIHIIKKYKAIRPLGKQTIKADVNSI